ncbi:single-stranded DNA-binding protein, partial [Candidatus Gracilibacteria bacterium]|nr:single-stranded DNA-binding protein [Candidatus Gracilibacteria bacterium]
TNRVWKDNSGKKEQIEFHNIVFWGKLAEVIGQYLKKGNEIYIDGRLQTSHWEDKTGVKKYKTEIIGEGLIMLGLPQQKQAKIIETVIEDSKEEEEELDEEVVVETKKKKKKGDLEEVPF